MEHNVASMGHFLSHFKILILLRRRFFCTGGSELTLDDKLDWSLSMDYREGVAQSWPSETRVFKAISHRKPFIASVLNRTERNTSQQCCGQQSQCVLSLIESTDINARTNELARRSHDRCGCIRWLRIASLYLNACAIVCFGRHNSAIQLDSNGWHVHDCRCLKCCQRMRNEFFAYFFHFFFSFFSLFPFQNARNAGCLQYY